MGHGKFSIISKLLGETRPIIIGAAEKKVGKVTGSGRRKTQP